METRDARQLAAVANVYNKIFCIQFCEKASFKILRSCSRKKKEISKSENVLQRNLRESPFFKLWVNSC